MKMETKKENKWPFAISIDGVGEVGYIIKEKYYLNLEILPIGLKLACLAAVSKFTGVKGEKFVGVDAKEVFDLANESVDKTNAGYLKIHYKNIVNEYGALENLTEILKAA